MDEINDLKWKIKSKESEIEYIQVGIPYYENWIHISKKRIEDLKKEIIEIIEKD